MYRPQKVDKGDNFLLRCTENLGDWGNPLSAIGTNAFRTTNQVTDLPCAMPNFTGIPAVTAKPASPVYE